VTDRLDKLKLKTIESKDLSPMISTENRIVVLPSTLLEGTNVLGLALLRWCRFLKYDIRMFTVQGTVVAEPAESESEIGLAFWKSLDDITSSVNTLKKKNNVTEEIRAFVRAQQIIGYITENKHLSVDILKRKHRYYGNNPSETTEQQVSAKNFKTVKVVYLKKELETYWREAKWRPQLAQIFVTLLRESWRAIDPEIMYANLESNLLTLDEFVKVYCAIPHEEPVKGQRGKTEIHMRVPSKPKESSMLLKAEQKILNDMSAKLFGNTYYEAHASEWNHILLGDGLSETKSYLQSLYKARSAYVRAFADLTTKRLTQIRKTVPDCKMKKKKDVTSTDLTHLLLLREDPLASFADEVLQMDPELTSFVGVALLDSEGSIARVPGVDKAKIKEIMVESLRTEGLYNDLERIREKQEAWTVYLNTKSEVYLQKRELLIAYYKEVNKRLIAGKTPEFRRGGIDDLIKLSQRQKQKSKAQSSDKKKGKAKEKAPKASGSTSSPSEDAVKEADDHSKAVTARSIRMTEFKEDLVISQEQVNEVFPPAYMYVEAEDDETTAKEYQDRILGPCWNKISDDRDDVVVYIVCLVKFISLYPEDDVLQAQPSITSEMYLKLSALDIAVFLYNEQRPKHWPKARSVLK